MVYHNSFFFNIHRTTTFTSMLQQIKCFFLKCYAGVPVAVILRSLCVCVCVCVCVCCVCVCAVYACVYYLQIPKGICI